MPSNYKTIGCRPKNEKKKEMYSKKMQYNTVHNSTIRCSLRNQTEGEHQK